MAPSQPAVDVPSLLREYDLGPLADAQPLAGGSAAVLRISAGRGSFVLKQAGRLADIELQARAAEHLNDRGVRQARILPTRAGGLVSSDGHYLQEFLPGAIALRPDSQQTSAAMRHIGAYHHTLADVPGEYVPDTGSLWLRVADPSYLLRYLPGLLARRNLAGPGELAALRTLDQSSRRLAGLPRQVVHGDVAPDNVLMQGNEVVAVIDFTPHYESELFGACAALYWYHVYGQPVIEADQLRASLAMIGQRRPWTEDELALWPTALLREALRRLATPLALAAELGAGPGAPTGPSGIELTSPLAAPSGTRSGTASGADLIPTLAARHAALLAVLRVAGRGHPDGFRRDK